MQATERSQGKSTQQNTIDIVAGTFYNGRRMARAVNDTLDAIRDRIVHDVSCLKETAKQMKQVSSAHFRYLDLQKQQEDHEKSAQSLIGLLGPDYCSNVLWANEAKATGEALDETTDAEVLRRELPLWQAIRQILRFRREAKVREILEFLETVDLSASRQAVESCIHTHPKTFRVVKRGREKFVSLRKTE